MDLKAILSAPMLGQLACSGLLICFVGYQATTVSIFRTQQIKWKSWSADDVIPIKYGSNTKTYTALKLD